MSTQIANADALVAYIQQFTGSSNDNEIKQCIYLAEMMMRNIELPALRTNPYTTIGVADEFGAIPIPADMNKPIVFFNQGNPGATPGSGPWIVYDRIGDRDIITQEMIQNLYLTPVNIPQVYRGKFGEVGQQYEFLPKLGAGQEINMYYYTTWPVLFSETTLNQIISVPGLVSTVTGSGPWTVVITGMSTNSGLNVGDTVTATSGVGSLGSVGGGVVISLDGTVGITIEVTGGTAPTVGSITNVTLATQQVQSNAVLQSWPEGYVYGTLHTYYAKRKNNEDATYWRAKFDDAWNTIEDQNNKGKWSGGHTRITSIFQPRRDQRYTSR
jgi:hypothetical protein